MLVAEKSISRAKTLEYVDRATLVHETQVIDAGLKYAIDVLASTAKNTTNVDHSNALLEASEALHTVSEHKVADFNHEENYEFRMTPIPLDEEFCPINFSTNAVQI
jgi:hypothetical protein